MFNDAHTVLSSSGGRLAKDSSATLVSVAPAVEYHSSARIFAVVLNMRRMSEARRSTVIRTR